MGLARAVAAILLASGFTATAHGQEFIANHIFVASPAEKAIREFDLNGHLVREFGNSLNLQNPAALAFGPTGHLYIADAGSGFVLEVDGLGQLVASHGASAAMQSPSAIAFGPQGNFFVACDAPPRVIEFDPSGTAVRELCAAAGIGAWASLLFSPEGHLWVSSRDRNSAMEFDPSGALLREFTHVDLVHPASPFASAEGLIYVLSPDSGRIVAFNHSGVAVRSLQDAAWASPCCAVPGPDGNIYVFDGAHSKMVACDALGKTVRVMEGLFTNPGPVAAAVSPVRFSVRLSAGILQDNAKQKWLREDATLSFFPGARRAMIQFAAGSGMGKDLASTLGAPAFVFHGSDRFAAVEPPSRSFQGMQIRPQAPDSPPASLTFQSVGWIDEQAAYSPLSLRGSLQIHAAGTACVALVTAFSRLN
jgi:hypothetical protein